MRTIHLLTLVLAILLAACSHADDPAALISSAKDYIAKRDYKASIIQLKNALQKEPNHGEARYLLGLSSLESGDLTSAEIELTKAIDLGLTSDEVQIAFARTLLAKGDANGLVSRFGSTTLSSPKQQAELRALTALAQLGRGRAAEGLKSLDESLTLDPANASANLAMARIAAAKGDRADAMKRLDAAVAAAPANWEVLVFKAELLAAQGENESAIKAYRAAIEAAPGQAAPRLSFVTHLLRQRSFDVAAIEIEAMQKATPRDVRTHYARALLLSEQRKFVEAGKAIQQVLKVSPNHVPSLMLAGMAAFSMRAYSEAEAHFRKAVFNAPGAIAAKRMLAATHLRMGQADVAMKEVRELLAKTGDNPDVLALAGEVHLAAGDAAGAARHYERARALKPESARVQTRLAQIRFATGDSEKGFAELEYASASHPGDYQADLALITLHLRQRQPDKALEALETLEQKQPNNPVTHYLRGVALLLKKDHAKARTSFERTVALDPTYMPGVASLARLDLRDKKPDVAKKRYEAVLKKEPNNERALLGMAVLLRVSGANPDEIEKLLKQSIAANPSSPTARVALVNHYLRSRDTKSALVAAQEAAVALPNPAMLEVLGLTQLAAGESRQAVTTLTRLTEQKPTSPQPYMHLARAHLAAKKPDEAIKSLRAALELDPDLSSAQRDIAAIYVSTGRADQAMREARSVQQDSPTKPIGYVLEAEIHWAQKNWEAAERTYRQAMKTFDLPVLTARTHAVMVGAGKAEEADALAEQWVKAHPKDALVLNYLAERDLAAKRYESAARRYEMALDRTPNNPLLLNNLAWVSHQLKRPDALEHAERAHELAPENPAIMDTLGGILAAGGETERGLELLGRAAELAPTAYQIRLNFAQALIKANRKSAARKELEALAKLDAKIPQQQEAAKLLSGL
jgi:putative PEP-CTERM system TPR-repeat lipoprotein